MGPAGRPPGATRADLVYGLVQRLADLAADARAGPAAPYRGWTTTWRCPTSSG